MGEAPTQAVNRPSRSAPTGPRQEGPRSAPPRPRAANPNPRKRMMAQGRKGHFIHDAKLVLQGPGGMDEQNVRAFLEGVFQRGTRQSSEQAIDYLGEKLQQGVITRDQANRLADLIDRYSFWR